MFQEPEIKELDDPERYYNFADVLQVLNSIEIDVNIGQNRNVKCNLKEILEFWEFLGASSFILSVINSVIFCLFGMPHAYYLRTTCLPVKKFGFVESSIAEVLESERIKQVSYKPVVLNPLSVFRSD